MKRIKEPISSSGKCLTIRTSLEFTATPTRTVVETGAFSNTEHVIAKSIDLSCEFWFSIDGPNAHFAEHEFYVVGKNAGGVFDKAFSDQMNWNATALLIKSIGEVYGFSEYSLEYSYTVPDNIEAQIEQAIDAAFKSLEKQQHEQYFKNRGKV